MRKTIYVLLALIFTVLTLACVSGVVQDRDPVALIFTLVFGPTAWRFWGMVNEGRKPRVAKQEPRPWQR